MRASRQIISSGIGQTSVIKDMDDVGDVARVGFTLIELLVVVSIIGVLSAMLMPAINAVRISAKGVQCISTLRQLGVASAVYIDDNEGRIVRIRDTTVAYGTTLWGGKLADYFDGTVPGYLSVSPMVTKNTCPSWKGVYNITTDEEVGGYGYAMNPYLYGPPWNASSKHNNFHPVDSGSFGANCQDIFMSAVRQSSKTIIFLDAVSWNVGGYASYAAGHSIAPAGRIYIDAVGTTIKRIGNRHSGTNVNALYGDIHCSSSPWVDTRVALDDPYH